MYIEEGVSVDTPSCFFGGILGASKSNWHIYNHRFYCACLVKKDKKFVHIGKK